MSSLLSRFYVIITSRFRSEHTSFGTCKHEASPPFLFYFDRVQELESRGVIAFGVCTSTFHALPLLCFWKFSPNDIYYGAEQSHVENDLGDWPWFVWSPTTLIRYTWLPFKYIGFQHVVQTIHLFDNVGTASWNYVNTPWPLKAISSRNPPFPSHTPRLTTSDPSRQENRQKTA